MKTRFYIDGFNLMHQWHGSGEDFITACKRLTDALIDPFPQLTDELILVFDGRADPHVLGRMPTGFQVVFCGARGSADAWIEHALQRERSPVSVTVVSNDNALRETARALGCGVLDCQGFILACENTVQRLHRPAHHRKGGGLQPKTPKLGRLGDAFPE